MKQQVLGLASSLAILMLAACASSSAGTTVTTSSTPVAQASSKPSPLATATATTVDPCQVVTQSEASQLAGTTYGAGKEETASSGAKLCWYGANTLNVFEVLVATATSAADAQAQWDQEKAQAVAELQKAVSVPGVTVSFNISDTTISGADRAAAGTETANYQGHTFSASAIYLLKGSVFLAIVDIVVGKPAPTVAAMEGQAQTSVGRLP